MLNLSEDQLNKALELKKKGNTVKQIIDTLKLDVNYNSFRVSLYRESLKRDRNIDFEDAKPVIEYDEKDIYEYYEKLKSLEDSIQELNHKQTSLSLKIEDDKPVCIAFWGDWHLGSKGLDYKQFDSDRKLIKETEGLYFIGMGDYMDNNNPYVTKSTNENSAPNDIQRLLVKTMIGEVKDKNLALIRGCHSAWSYKLDSHDFIEDLCSEFNLVNMWHGGLINIKLGEESYKIFARHKYKNESSLNTTNAQRNMLNDIGPCDVLALGHKHFPDLQMLDRMGQKVVYLRSGSYKKYDEFGQQIGGYSGKKAVPCVILYPDSHKIVPFQELEDAIIYLKAVRN